MRAPVIRRLARGRVILTHLGNGASMADASQEETAHKVAWAAVKQHYEKRGDDWHKKL